MTTSLNSSALNQLKKKLGVGMPRSLKFLHYQKTAALIWGPWVTTGNTTFVILGLSAWISVFCLDTVTQWIYTAGKFNVHKLFLLLLESYLCLTQLSASIYLLKVNNRNTVTRCAICSKLTIKTAERRHWRCFGLFVVIFEHISHLVLVFLLLTLNM